MSSFNYVGGGFTARLRYEAQRHSPVTRILEKTFLADWAALACVAARTTANYLPVPDALVDQFHQAELRLLTPDVFSIPSSGVHIGEGIWIKRVRPEQLGEESRKMLEHVRLFEVFGQHIKGRPGLHAFIAVHSLMAVDDGLRCIGSTSMRGDYPSREEAIKDVLRFSKAMTNKCAAMGIPIGGGKCVILFDPSSPHKDTVLKQFAKALEFLKVIYTGPGTNLSARDGVNMGLVAPHAVIAFSDIFSGIYPNSIRKIRALLAEEDLGQYETANAAAAGQLAQWNCYTYIGWQGPEVG